MSQTRIKVAASLAFVLLATTTVFAADSAVDVRQRMGAGDPVAGRSKIAICQACHGADGNGSQQNYPKLAGQYADYIVKQINDFKSGLRKDPMMSAMVQSAGSDKDMLDVAAYFASLDQMKSAKRVHNKAGKKRFEDAESGCSPCHGLNGKGMAPDQPYAPVIGGQHRDYLVKQLKNFRKGTRSNDPGGIMGLVTASMTDDEIENVAAYVSGL